MEPFTPKGEKALRELVYDMVSGSEVGTLFDYATIRQRTGVDVREDRGPIYGATELLQKRDHRTLVNVRGEGYRVAAASEHVTLAKGRQRRAGVQVNKGIKTLHGTKVGELTGPELTAHELMVIRMDGLQTQLRRHDRRLKVLEEANVVKTDDDAARDAKIARLERELNQVRQSSDSISE